MKEQYVHEKVYYPSPMSPLSHFLNKELNILEKDVLTRTLWHEEFEFKYILSGRSEIVCGNRVYLARRGDLVVINPCELHLTRLFNEQPCRYHLLMISPEHLLPFDTDQMLGNVCSGKLHIRNLISGDSYIREEFTDLAEALQRKEPGYTLNAFGRLSKLMSYLLEHYTEADSGENTELLRQQAQRLEPAFLLLTQQYHKDLTLDQLAECCCMSASHFCHIFKLVTGKSAIAYLTQLRINKAELMLNTTDLPVTNIAAAVGYSDNAYFSRVFRKVKGYSPTKRPGKKE